MKQAIEFGVSFAKKAEKFERFCCYACWKIFRTPWSCFLTDKGAFQINMGTVKENSARYLI